MLHFINEYIKNTLQNVLFGKLTPQKTYLSRVRRIYICGRLFRIPAHAELSGLFHLFALFLKEFDYTARVQFVLHITGYS